MTTKVRVFIASSTGALSTYRAAARDVCTRLNLIPICMEDFTSDTSPPADICKRELEQCEVMLVIIGHRYGSRPPNQPKSYTELEYEWAIAAGLQVLALVVDRDQPWLPDDIDQGEEGAALAQFLELIQRRHTTQYFSTVSDFREKVIYALRFTEMPINKLRLETVGPGKNQDSSPLSVMPTAPKLYAQPPYIGNGPFTGRVAELRALSTWARSDVPILVIEAIGGVGKSALTWTWLLQHAPHVVNSYQGAVWFSFYEGSASIVRFARSLIAYDFSVIEESIEMSDSEIVEAAVRILNENRYVVVLDGFERLLRAYHQFDPTKLLDDDVDPTLSSFIEPLGAQFLRSLTVSSYSKILISTRLIPDALRGNFGRNLPGVQTYRLGSLSDTDTLVLLRRLGIACTPQRARAYFRRLGNHALLIGVVAGIVRSYREAPGDLGVWLDDPNGGGELRINTLNLSQRRTHILQVALSQLDNGANQVLNVLATFSGPVSWQILQAIFTRLVAAPVITGDVEEYRQWLKAITRRPRGQPRDSQQIIRTWRAVIAGTTIGEMDYSDSLSDYARLDRGLNDLEELGLLWWDKGSNTYDLHPIVRSYVFDSFTEQSKKQAHRSVRDYFRSHPPLIKTITSTLEELSSTITLYRAFLGSEQPNEALALWKNSLADQLMKHLGAWPTVTELLPPLIKVGPSELLIGQLAEAHYRLYDYDQSYDLQVMLLDRAMESRDRVKVHATVHGLTRLYISSERFAEAARCISLENLVLDVRRSRRRCSVCRIDLAIRLGHISAAEALFSKLQQTFGPEKINHDILLLGLRIKFITGQLELDDLPEVMPEQYTFDDRQTISWYRGRTLIRYGRTTEGLEELQRYSDAQSGVGRRPLPLSFALVMAEKGNVEKASVALEECLSMTEINYCDGPTLIAIARLCYRLERREEAARVGLEAYKKIWGVGPPYLNTNSLKNARVFLDSIGVTVPNLAKVRQKNRYLPFEERIRAWARDV
jgi:hypothetical protein